MIKSLLTIYRVLRREFGLIFRPIPTGILIIMVQCFSRTMLFLDNLFFSGYKKVKIDRPIFIIGNPRSGTTVMQRFLHETDEVCSFQVWQMFVPSILGQKILGPFIPFFARLNPARHYATEAHETGLDSVETDEALLSFRFLEGLFIYLFFLAWSAEDELKKLLDTYKPGSETNAKVLKYYTACLRRNLYISGKNRVLGKPFTFNFRIVDAVKAFPDARFIYMVRDPADVIPSGINMVYNVTDKQFGTKKFPKEKQERYFKNLYRGECAFYREFHKVYSEGKIPKENILVVRFPDMMKDFENVMLNILDFCDFDVSDEFREKISAQDEKQKNYKSKHSYNLEQYNLSREQIRKDLDFVYEEYQLDQ